MFLSLSWKKQSRIAAHISFLLVSMACGSELNELDTQPNAIEQSAASDLRHVVLIDWPLDRDWGDIFGPNQRKLLGIVIGPHTILSSARGLSRWTDQEDPLSIDSDKLVRFFRGTQRPSAEGSTHAEAETLAQVAVRDLKIYRHFTFDEWNSELIVPRSKSGNYQAIFDLAVIQLPSNIELPFNPDLYVINQPASIAPPVKVASRAQLVDGFWGEELSLLDTLVSKEVLLNASDRWFYKTLAHEEEAGSGGWNHSEDYGAALYRQDPQGQTVLYGLFSWGYQPSYDEQEQVLMASAGSFYTRFDHAFRWIYAMRYCSEGHWCGLNSRQYKQGSTDVETVDNRFNDAMFAKNDANRPSLASLSDDHGALPLPVACGDLLFEEAGPHWSDASVGWTDHFYCYNEGHSPDTWGAEWIDLGATFLSRPDGYAESCKACLVHTGCLPGEC
ncbi:MAG: hypothetical protein IPJ88_01070 [Myxococcales bacterium]|nr:MAG: hypothetical protein IPJ88_01070 [Myxococcales bacterium]